MANENQDQGQGDGGGISVETIKTAGVPDTYLKDGAYDFGAISKDLGELSTLRTSQADRAKLIPQDGKYDFSLPKDFKIEGFQGEWKPDETFTGVIANLAKEMGLTQTDLSKLVTAYAQHDAGKKIAEAKAEAEAEANFSKELKAVLGNDADARLKRTEDALKAKGYGALIDPKASFKDRWAILDALANDPQRQAAKGGNGHDSKPDLSKMNARQKLDYANEQSMRAKH